MQPFEKLVPIYQTTLHKDLDFNEQDSKLPLNGVITAVPVVKTTSFTNGYLATLGLLHPLKST
jgi:hypothetical protein